jgi:hypothetical protein
MVGLMWCNDRFVCVDCVAKCTVITHVSSPLTEIAVSSEL